MSDLRNRLRERKRGLVSRSNSCIPQLVSSDPIDIAKQFFQSVLHKNYSVDKVTVIDPYILPIDIDSLSMLFGGRSSVSLEVVSKFESFEGGEEKDVRKSMIENRAEYMAKNGIFMRVEFIHSLQSMHDRYYIFWENLTIKSVYFVGGSIGQKFESYIGILEVNDLFMISNIKRYYESLLAYTKDF